MQETKPQPYSDVRSTGHQHNSSLIAERKTTRNPYPTLSFRFRAGDGAGQAVQVELLRIVKRVKYIGGLPVRTQAFLLPGLVRVIMDSPLELRKPGAEQGWVHIVLGAAVFPSTSIATPQIDQ